MPLGEDSQDRLSGGDDGVDLGCPGRRVGGEAVEFRTDLLLGADPLGGDKRDFEAAVTDLPGQVADRRIAQLSGPHQLLHHPPVAVTDLAGQ